MGSPKPWLLFDGAPLLEHLVRRAAAVFPEVLVVAAPGQELPGTAARVVYDERPGEGPVAGLAVGLREATRPLAFVSSCDTPFVRMDVARLLVERCEGFDAAAPEWNGRLQPLQAVYRTSLQPLVERELAAGHRRLTALFALLRARIVTEEEIRATDPAGRTLLNMNTPADYRRALELWNDGSQEAPRTNPPVR
ncbi:MAG: putative molybdopterin-guanine dinucleotide biosynthesis protein [Armatimonadetes bacterium]|jgi:molybdopterin-guanine dinucleotide biosynthesis protein A|nr:putative molybdopterin-guanine dinucleotide biosynthesis protein [Armatimonadota bacterium]